MVFQFSGIWAIMAPDKRGIDIIFFLFLCKNIYSEALLMDSNPIGDEFHFMTVYHFHI